METHNQAVPQERRERQENSPYEAVGAGNWLARIWKDALGDDEWRYSFSLSRLPVNGFGGDSERFDVGDLFDVLKLAEVLGKTLLDDGCLDEELKNDLECFVGLLEPFVSSVWSNTSPWVCVKRAWIMTVLEYLWRDELMDFASVPAAERRAHVFRALANLRGAVEGWSQKAEDWVARGENGLSR